MRLKRIITAIAVAALLFSLILNLSLPAMALSDNLDYGRESSGEEESLTPSELLEKIIDTEISDVERKYLDKHSKVVLKYDSGITSSYVKSDYVAANGELTVRARPYSYTAENGATVTWLPTVITLDGREGTQRFEGDECISVFGGVTEDDNTRAEVTYKASFTVGKDTVNSLLNMAYNDAVFGIEDIARRNAEYDRLYAQYTEEKLAYEDYLERLSQYESDYALYTKYLQDKRIYEELRAEYEDYLALLDDFNEKNEVYLAYLEAEENYKKQYTEYLAYKRACEEYEVNKPLYEQYLVDIEVARAQLKVIDAIKVKMTDGRTVYDAVMGSTVTSVLENKDLITSNIMGAREDVVDLAGNATEKLRELFRDYFSLKTEEQKYNYYVNNYESFKTSFRELLVALDNLYRVRMVRATLISEGKDKKYIILVSQLYIIATALSEEEITSYDGKYKYNDSFTIENQTPKNILEKKTYFEKVNPIPLKSGYPTEIKEPKLPEVELTEPKKPTPVEKPTAPDYVQKPDEPKAVAEPTAPDEVGKPIPEPVKYEPPAELLSIIDEYGMGQIRKRPEHSEDFTLVLDTTVKKQIFNVEVVTATFYSAHGQILHQSTVDRGTRVTFSGVLPTKAEDSSATYSFAYWGDRNANPVDLSAIGTDVSLYPYFKTNYKSFTVGWTVDGVRVEEVYLYGSTPEYKGSPQKPDDSVYAYEFAGWDSEIVKVTGDAEYTARFEQSYIAEYVGGGAEIGFDGNNYTVDYSDAAVYKCDITGVIARAAGKGGIVIYAPTATVSISFKDVISLKNEGACYVSYRIIEEKYRTRIRISLIDGDGELIEGQYKLSAELNSVDAKGAAKLYRVIDGEKKHVSFKYSDSLAFTAIAGEEYILSEEYRVSVTPSDLAEILISGDVFTVGDEVSVSVKAEPQIEIRELYYVDEDGKKTVINGGVFKMPDSNVTVYAECYKKVYTVIFADGKNVLSVQSVPWGEMPQVPENPLRTSDGEYSYTFKGWSREVVPVSRNVTYSAVYEKTPLPPKVEPGGLQISDPVKKILLTAAVLAVLFVVLIVTVLVVIIRKKLRK